MSEGNREIKRLWKSVSLRESRFNDIFGVNFSNESI
jgi:hypothetical protein